MNSKANSMDKFIPISADIDLKPGQLKRRGKNGGAEEESASAFDVPFEYKGIYDSFSTVMLSILQYVKQVSVASLKSLDSNLAGAYGVMENLIKDAARKKFKKSDLNVVIEFMDKKSEKKQSVEVPLYDWEKFQKVSEFMNVAVAAPKIQSETSLQQIVNQWEYLLGGFIRARFETNSDLINGQTLVSYEKIKCLKNIDEVKRLFADQIVGDVMGETSMSS